MDPDVVAVPCPGCQITSESAGQGLEHWACPACRRSYFLRRCGTCGMVSHVGALQGWHQRWHCVWCRAANAGFTQHRDPAAATIAELAADVAGYGLAFTATEPEFDTLPVPLVTLGQVSAGPAGQARGEVPAVIVPAAGRPDHDRPRVLARRPRHRGRAAGSRRLARRVAVLAVVTIALVVVAAVLAAPAEPGRASGTTRAVSVTARAVGTVDLRGVPGQLTIVGTAGGRVALTGQLHWTGQAPAAAARLDRAAGVLYLSYRCAAASPCTENYRLAVPGSTATVINQPAGRVVVSGLAGSLSITAHSADISATGLRSPALAAAITSGHLSASFDVPPRQVSVALTSAQATVWLPVSVAYLVSSQVTSGHVTVAVPQARGAASTVTDHIYSGELDLLSAR